MIAPRKAPTISATQYTPAVGRSIEPLSSTASVTAGLRWAPLIGPAINTPVNTANAHAVVMTIQPLFWAFERLSRTPATTPSPSRTRAPVPSTSARKIWPALSGMLSSSLLRGPLQLRPFAGNKKSPRLGTTAEGGTCQVIVPSQGLTVVLPVPNGVKVPTTPVPRGGPPPGRPA